MILKLVEREEKIRSRVRIREALFFSGQIWRLGSSDTVTL